MDLPLLKVVAVFLGWFLKEREVSFLIVASMGGVVVVIVVGIVVVVVIVVVVGKWKNKRMYQSYGPIFFLFMPHMSVCVMCSHGNSRESPNFSLM